jgi:hypothetical protein
MDNKADRIGRACMKRLKVAVARYARYRYTPENLRADIRQHICGNGGMSDFYRVEIYIKILRHISLFCDDYECRLLANIAVEEMGVL